MFFSHSNYWTFAYTVADACDKRELTLIRLDRVIERDGAVSETAQQWLTQDEIAAAAISHTAERFDAGGTRHAAEVACPAYTGDPDDIYDGELIVDEDFLADGATFPKTLVYRLFERAYAPTEATVEWEVTDSWNLVAGAGQEVAVDVPAGTFSCIELNRVRQYQLISGEPDGSREDQDQTLWFARKVGLVKRSTIGYGAGTEELECWGIAGD